MASIIRIKRSSVAGNPTTLAAGELAYSGLTDNGSNGGDRLYIGLGTETSGNAANHIVIGGKYFTDMLDHTPGTLTASSAIIVDSSSKINNINVGNITVTGSTNTISSTDTNGNIVLTPNGSGKTVLNNPYINGTTDTLAEFIYDTVGGAVTGTAGQISVTNSDVGNTSTIALVNTAVTAGSYGSATAIPTFTVDAQGRLTAASTASISTTLTVAADSGTADSVALGTDTLTFTGGTGLDSVVSNNTITFNIDNTVVTLTGTQTLTNKTLTNPTITGLSISGVNVTDSSITFEGATADAFETTLTVTDPTADRTVTIPDATGTVVLADLAQTLTNKTISGTNNTLSNIGNSSLTNSSVTVGTTNIALGATSTTLAGLTSVTSTGFTGALTGNASTATTLQTARTISISGDATGTVSFDGSANADIAVTISANAVALGTDTTGNYVATIAGTTNQVSVSGSGSETAAVTLSLPQNIHSAATPTFAGMSLTGALAMGSSNITGLADPVNAQDAATKAYVDAARAGLDVKQSVRAATTANITLSGTQTVDGVALAVGNRVLVKNQTTGTQNGIYVVASGAWSRATDADEPNEVSPGLFLFVEEGTLNADNGYVITSDSPLTVGTDAIVFTQFSGAGMIVAGNALTKTGNTLDVVVAASGGIEIVSDALQLKSSLAGDGLSYSSGVLSLASAAAGAGLSYTTGVLAVNTANGLEISGDNVQLASSVAGTGLTLTAGVLDVVGTTNRITANANSIDIASTYVGQTSITTLGTITTGTWTGSVIADAYIADDLTISGGTINNTPIGGTTRSTGAFTTLNANSTTTLAGMTATTGSFSSTLGVTGNVTLAANLTGAGAGTSTLDGFGIDGGTY